MTIICSMCGDIPPTYTYVGSRLVCLNCKDWLYEKELKMLKDKYGK